MNTTIAAIFVLQVVFIWLDLSGVLVGVVSRNSILWIELLVVSAVFASLVFPKMDHVAISYVWKICLRCVLAVIMATVICMLVLIIINQDEAKGVHARVQILGLLFIMYTGCGIVGILAGTGFTILIKNLQM